MATTIAQLTTDLATLQTSVNQLITAFQSAAAPDVTPQDTTVNSMNTAIQAALAPPASPPAA